MRVGRNQNPDRSSLGEPKGSQLRVNRRLPADLRAPSAMFGGEARAAGVFVRDEVPVAREEEGRVHLARHRLVRHVVAASRRSRRPASSPSDVPGSSRGSAPVTACSGPRPSRDRRTAFTILAIGLTSASFHNNSRMLCSGARVRHAGEGALPPGDRMWAAGSRRREDRVDQVVRPEARPSRRSSAGVRPRRRRGSRRSAPDGGRGRRPSGRRRPRRPTGSCRSRAACRRGTRPRARRRSAGRCRARRRSAISVR